MHSMLHRLALLALAGALFTTAAAAASRIVIVVGPTNHPPGTHEVAAGGRLLQQCLQSMTNVPGVQADLFYEWPEDSVLADARSLVFIGDIFPPQRLADSPLILSKVADLMKRGCGLVCVHYATGLRAVDVPADGNHPLLQWLGGYFATKNVHHQSVAKVFDAVTITPATPGHPVSRGWRAFTVPEEPYYKNYFGPGANQLAPNVTALATAQLPPEAPQREVVAWVVERTDTGRGFGIVMPHFYKNWRNDDLRRFIMNGIVWTAKLEVPAGGVETAPPDLARFEPVAVEPAPRTPKKK